MSNWKCCVIILLSISFFLKFANEKQTNVHENGADQFALDFDARRANGARSHSGRRGRMSWRRWRRGLMRWRRSDWLRWRSRWRMCWHNGRQRDDRRHGGFHARAILYLSVQTGATLVLFARLHVGAERKRYGKSGVLFVDISASERLIDAFAVGAEPFDFVERCRWARLSDRLAANRVLVNVVQVDAVQVQLGAVSDSWQIVRIFLFK